MRLLLTALVSLISVPEMFAQEGPFRVLFGGSSLEGWSQVGDANWTLGEGRVSADSGNGFLVTEESFADFELTLDFWVDEPANSGVFIRCSDAQEIGSGSCYEVNIFDTRPDSTYATGSIVDFAEPSEVITAGGQWNRYAIRADGPRLVIRLNGVETVNTTDDTYAAGPIALQYGGGVVRFRNVQIRTLD